MIYGCSFMAAVLELIERPSYSSIAFVRGNSGEPVPEEHSPTHTYRGRERKGEALRVYLGPRR